MKWVMYGIFCFACVSQGAYIEKIKGRKTLIYLDGLDVQKGDLVNVRDEIQQKIIGILRIKTVKDGKAIGEVVKGKARLNLDVTTRKQDSKNSNDTARASKKNDKSMEADVPVSFKPRYAIGGMLGLGFDSMDIQIGDPRESIAQSGVGSSIVGAFDYRWIPWISLRGLLGLEKFQTDGNAALSTTVCSNCKTDITYMSSMLWGRFHITQTPTTIWVGPGMGYYIPVSKTSNSIDISTLKNTFVFGVAGGVDIAIKPKFYIPIHLEYMFLSDSDDAKQSFYAIRSGLLFKF